MSVTAGTAAFQGQAHARGEGRGRNVNMTGQGLWETRLVL